MSQSSTKKNKFSVIEWKRSDREDLCKHGKLNTFCTGDRTGWLTRSTANKDIGHSKQLKQNKKEHNILLKKGVKPGKDKATFNKCCNPEESLDFHPFTSENTINCSQFCSCSITFCHKNQYFLQEILLIWNYFNPLKSSKSV